VSNKLSAEHSPSVQKSDENPDDVFTSTKESFLKSNIEFQTRKVKHSRKKLPSLNENSKQSSKTLKFETNLTSINFDRPPRKYFEPQTYIAPGNIGTQKTQVQWNRNSNRQLGTDKTQCLRFDQYMARPQIDQRQEINANRFERLNDLTKVNSKYRKVIDFSVAKSTARKPEQSPLQPKAENDVVSYDEEIPRFYKGQPGFKEYEQARSRNLDLTTKLAVECKTDSFGQLEEVKLYNIPGM
jgi:hypothetical protein